jgi:hypothetical protein
MVARRHTPGGQSLVEALHLRGAIGVLRLFPRTADGKRYLAFARRHARSLALAVMGPLVIWLFLDLIAAEVSVALRLVASVLLGAAMVFFSEGWAEQGSKTGIASALVGAVVAFVILGLQSATEEQRRNIEQRQQSIADEARAQQERIADRQDLQVTISMQNNLAGIDLADRKLDGFYFRGKVLRDARLVRASLREANLTGADLTGADLSQANLSGASLRGANLRGARLRDALLNEADLTGANFLASDLRGADFFSTVLHRTRFCQSQLWWSYTRLRLRP